MDPRLKAITVLAAAWVALGAAPAKAESGPLGLSDCGPAEGVEVCSGLVKTWDGVPLDTTVSLPADGATEKLPLVVEVHGFGNSKYEYLNPDETAYTDNAYAWARDGYAVLTFTARGLWGSCGTPQSRLADPTGCAAGYIHLADVRYEVRDIQELIGRLVDERVADPARIGVTGDSYGGGQTLMLAALRDRVMLPDGSLVRWRSPDGTPLRLAAAAPVIPWTDLVSAAAPNGRISSTAITPRSVATDPVGVEKASVVNAIFAASQFATGPGQPTGEPFVPGRPMGFLAPTGLDPGADVTAWVSRTSAGEPYDDASTKAIVDTLARFHSAYYVPADHRPPPLFLASGLTDDLFPADETLRFANRTAKRYPGLPMSILLGDFGHQRASNEPAERRLLLRSIHGWFDHYLRDRGRPPRTGVTAFAQTCPRDAPAGPRFRAAQFSALARGVVRIRGKQPQTVSSTGVDSTGGPALDPVAGMGDGCAVVGPGDPTGSASYSRKVSTRRPLTLVGSPTIRARLAISGAPPSSTEIAARLFDVAPDGTKRLVARGLYRPDEESRAAWQLHPAAWTFPSGDTIELQLLGADPPYSRPANSAFETAVSHLRLRLPVRQRLRG
jgi:X-Pro dipeptidyl-peptidase (S15 family)/X-Pro dipeptidyl-peptidase C-terminal non-catalytic domain